MILIEFHLIPLFKDQNSLQNTKVYINSAHAGNVRFDNRQPS